MRLTRHAYQRITTVLARVTLPRGVGGQTDEQTKKLTACSIAAINLALTGSLVDQTPACMNRHLASWIINVQDNMRETERNALRWRILLPDAAGTAGTDDLEMAKALAEFALSLPELDKLDPHVRVHLENLLEAAVQGRYTDSLWEALNELYAELACRVSEVATDGLEKALACGFWVVEDEDCTEEEIAIDRIAEAEYLKWLASYEQRAELGEPVEDDDDDEDEEDD
jgi:hypothetical protein